MWWGMATVGTLTVGIVMGRFTPLMGTDCALLGVSGVEGVEVIQIGAVLRMSLIEVVCMKLKV